MSNIIFQNKGILSLIDLTTMGDSSKKEDSSKIGQFDSGLKYAISILYRNNISMSIFIGKDKKFKFLSEEIESPDTGKKKTIIAIYVYNLIEDSWILSDKIKTSFAVQLGYGWENWMAIRELYSNCIDEKGSTYFNRNDINYSIEDYTTIVLESDLLDDIIEDWDKYFISNNKYPILGNKENNDVKIYENNTDYLQLYKNGILIYKDEDIKAHYSYDYPSASIDEMRILNDSYSFRSQVSYKISTNENNKFTEKFLTSKIINENTYEDEFEFYSISETIKDVVRNIYETNKTILTYDGLYSRLMKLDDIYIGVKKISSSLSESYLHQVKVEIKEELPKEEILSFEDNVKKICSNNNFEIKFPVKKSEMLGHTCIPNIYDKVIYVTDKFDETYMWEIIKAQFRIEGDNEEDYVYKKYVELLK